MLRIGGPDRIGFVRHERLRHVANRRLLPRHVLLLLHHEAQILLGCVRILRVLEDHHRKREMQLGRLADGPDREVGMPDVLGQLLQLFVLRGLGCVVNRDAVVGDADLPVEERLVVVRIQPRQRAGNEGLVELLRVFERGDRLRTVDDDVVLLVDHLAAVRPYDPVAPGVGVARRVAQREAGRQTLGFQSLAKF